MPSHAQGAKKLHRQLCDCLAAAPSAPRSNSRNGASNGDKHGWPVQIRVPIGCSSSAVASTVGTPEDSGCSWRQRYHFHERS